LLGLEFLWRRVHCCVRLGLIKGCASVTDLGKGKKRKRGRLLSSIPRLGGRKKVDNKGLARGPFRCHLKKKKKKKEK